MRIQRGHGTPHLFRTSRKIIRLGTNLISLNYESQNFTFRSSFSITTHRNPFVIHLFPVNLTRKRSEIAVLMKIWTKTNIDLVVPCIFRSKSDCKRPIIVAELIQFSARHDMAGSTQKKQILLIWSRLRNMHESLGFVHLEFTTGRRVVKQCL
ncbi:hypothetical protein BD408DRAFT_164606 [Parasitella parasitica]|nr:hypothetical protein BD408DRAFT_164606 [Parasitella parasitica]